MTTRQIKVWDLPLRLTHWSFAVLVMAMWYTAENSLWWWHTRLGMVLLALLIFRVIWGFVGTRTARFTNFVKGPGAVLDYVRGRYRREGHIGHEPLGALAVLALLTVMFVQVGMGLFAGDPYDGATGPLNPLMGVMTADTITEWHEDFLYVVLGMAGLHVVAIGVYAMIRKDDLVGPMITGNRDEKLSVEGIEAGYGARAMLAFTAAAAIAVWVWFGAPPLT